MKLENYSTDELRDLNSRIHTEIIRRQRLINNRIRKEILNLERNTSEASE